MRNRTAKRLTLEVRRGPTANAKVKSPLKLDPTRTLTIRRAFAAKLRAAYARLKGRLVKLVQDDDTYGLGAVRNAYNVSPPTDWDALNAETDQRMERAVWGDSGKGARDNVPRWGATPHDPHTAFPSGEVRNAALYAFASDPQKLAAFQAWLRGQLAQLVIGHTQEQLWDAYIQAGFKKGAGRAFDDVRQSELAKRRPDLFTRTSQDSVKDFYAGTKDEFLRSSFAQPVAKEKVELLASRSFDELEDVTSTMANRMSRVLTDGLVQGQSPRDVAKTLADEVDIGQERALLIARTEIIRAHAEGQLTALENLGVEEVGVAVEWSTADDELVCPLCESLEGVVLKLDEARGMLPRHPNCRCAWVPANVGEDDKDQKDTKGEIDDAFDGAGLDITADKDRPQSIVGNELDWRWWTLEGPRADVLDAFSVALNAFCPTGPGGGINPHCSPGGGTGPTGTHGVPVGHSLVKTHRGQAYTVTATPNGFSVSGPNMGALGQRHFPSLTAAAQAVQGHGGAVNGWRFFGAVNPALGTPAPAAPTPAPVPAPVATPGPVQAPVPPPVHIPATAPKNGSGLAVGTTFSKQYNGVTHTAVITPAGVSVTGLGGAVTHYSSLSAAAKGIKGNNVNTNGWAFFGARQPASSAPPAPTAPKPATSAAPIPHLKEITWETGKAGNAVSGSGKPVAGEVLNGVPFASAPPKFWEHTKDVTSFKEPPSLHKIDRVGVLIQEPDGRVWIAQPTNGYGNRKYTVPGGGVEKGLSNQQNALKETWEETGLHVEITGHLGDFKDSNNGKMGRLYAGKRIGGSPWDAKVEDGSHGGPTIISQKTGKPAAESDAVSLVTHERAAQLLHRTDDLAQLATVAPMPLKTKTDGQMMNKLVEGLQPAAQAYKSDKISKNLTPGDSTLHAIQELRGFNGKPTLVAKTDMDALIKQGTHTELLRGVSAVGNFTAKNLADQFKTGEHFPGYGCFGNGTYADAMKGSTNVVVSGRYGAGGDTIRIALPKTAKIIKQSELEKIAGSAPKDFQDGHHSSRTGGLADGWLGSHAALAGYDAIHVDGGSARHGTYGSKSDYNPHDYHVILNRSILVVQKESAKGHVIQ